MDLRAIQFDPATLDQLIAATQPFLPDIDALPPDFSAFAVGGSVVGNGSGSGQAAAHARAAAHAAQGRLHNGLNVDLALDPDQDQDEDHDQDHDHEHDHFSAGSSPRDDQSHTSGDAPLKASSGAAGITEEERSMLASSGVVIPRDAITLTKAEEKALKSVRRRLRNKISAQDSRRKKKEYVDGLEQRVASCTAVNIEMQSKVNTLVHENRSLRQQLLQLKEMVARLGGPQSAATTGTILMVLALSFSMFINPLSSSVAPNATAPTSTEAPLPTPGSRTLKALPPPSSTASAFAPPPASLRDVLSSWLFERRREEEDEHQAPPSLAPLKRPVRAGAP